MVSVHVLLWRPGRSGSAAASCSRARRSPPRSLVITYFGLCLYRGLNCTLVVTSLRSASRAGGAPWSIAPLLSHFGAVLRVAVNKFGVQLLRQTAPELRINRCPHSSTDFTVQISWFCYLLRASPAPGRPYLPICICKFNIYSWLPCWPPPPRPSLCCAAF